MVNKQGQTRLAQYYEYLTLEERRALEGEIVRKCLARNEQQVPFQSYLDPRFNYSDPSSVFSIRFMRDSTFWFRILTLKLFFVVFDDGQCSFVEHRNYKIVYRRYASLFFLVGVDDDEVN